LNGTGTGYHASRAQRWATAEEDKILRMIWISVAFILAGAVSAQTGTFAGRVNTTQTETAAPVRNDAARPSDEIVTLRYFKIRKGTFDQFLKASQDAVWPYYEKIGSRIIGMWQVTAAEGVEGAPKASPDYDEVYLMTRYASVAHWAATREPVKMGGNGPDWEKCKQGLALRTSLTLETHVTFLKGRAGGGPYYMPGLAEKYEKK
jgi:hypothetical protein